MNSGTLYVVATPIGNLEDITPRAVRVLKEAHMIAAEDTRHSRGLLTHFEIKTPMFSCHKFNEGKRGDFFVAALREGRDVALISDAGTPCISDPGHRLVRMASEADIPVVAVCGASAAIAALSVSGFDASQFTFLGFLPRGKEAKCLTLPHADTVVFYESPRRVVATLKIAQEIFPKAQICLCNDISKKFERVYRGSADEIINELSDNPSSHKGEYTCVINLPDNGAKNLEENPDKAETPPSPESLLVDTMIKHECSLRDAAQILRDSKAFSKNELYAASLNLKHLFSKSGR